MTIATDNCLRIKTISIITQDVYEDDDSPNYLESTLNYLHYTTRNHVVEDELLFRKNECFDPELVDETARNLRSLPIFSDATIRVEHLQDGSGVDLVVKTKDRFTFRAEISASQNAGTTSGRISLGDKNFLGLNKEVLVHRLREGEDDESEFVYRDPRFFHDYLLYVAYTQAEDGVRQNYFIKEPFRSFDDKLSYSLFYQKNDQDFGYSLDGNKSIDVPQNYEATGLNYRRELGTRKISKRVGASLQITQHEFFGQGVVIDETIPEPLDRIDFDLSTSLTFRDDFLETQGLDSLIYREDIALGRSIGASVGAQRRQADGGESYHHKFRVSASQTAFIHPKFLSSVYAGQGIRMHGGDLMASDTTAFYHGYYLPSPGYVWLGGAAYRYRHGKDILNSPLTMGGFQGLRGYEGGSFTGNKTLLFNLEFRHRIPFDWQKVAVGQVFFADAGYAWKHGTDMRLKDLQKNVGWGLRLDVPSLFGKNVMRFDLAVATETGEVLTSILFGQVFRYNGLADN